MKTIVNKILLLTLAFAVMVIAIYRFISADNETQSRETATTTEKNVQRNTNQSLMIAYFSWADNATGAENADAMTSPSVHAPGHVGQLARWIQEEIGGSLFSIRVNEPYPSDWDDCLERANEERSQNDRPSLQQRISNIDQYDTIFLGYPNWWYGVPMALLTFLEENDLTDKQIYLFCSHGTGGLAQSVDQIEDAIPDAIISENIFDCYEEDVSSSKSDLQKWLIELGY